MPPNKKTDIAALYIEIPRQLVLRVAERAKQEGTTTHEWANPIVVAALEAKLAVG